MAPVTWAHGGAGAPGSLSSAHCSGACTPVCAGPARGAHAPRARVGLRRPHARLPALHSSHPPLRGSVVCSALQQYQNFKKTGTGRRGGPGQGTQRQDDSGRSWCREYQVHLISSQEGLGLSGAGVTEKQCCPLPPLGHCSPGQLGCLGPAAVLSPLQTWAQKTPSPQAPVQTLPCAHFWPWAAALPGEGCSGLPARQGSLVAHARNTGTMICALLGGGGGGVCVGGLHALAGPRGLQSPSSEK